MFSEPAVHQPVEDPRRVVGEVAGRYRSLWVNSFIGAFDDMPGRLGHAGIVGRASLV